MKLHICITGCIVTGKTVSTHPYYVMNCRYCVASFIISWTVEGIRDDYVVTSEACNNTLQPELLLRPSNIFSRTEQQNSTSEWFRITPIPLKTFGTYILQIIFILVDFLAIYSNRYSKTKHFLWKFDLLVHLDISLLFLSTSFVVNNKRMHLLVCFNFDWKIKKRLIEK